MALAPAPHILRQRTRAGLTALALLACSSFSSSASELSPEAAAQLRVPRAAVVQSNTVAQRLISGHDLSPQSTTSLGDSNGAWFTFPPPRRANHAAIYDPVRDRMVVFAGGPARPDEATLTLAFDGEPAWNPFPVNNSSPPLGTGYVGFYDSTADRMIAYGVNAGYQDREGLIWQLDLSGSPRWSLRGFLSGARRNPAVAFDAVHRRLIVFGGMRDTTLLNDVWTFDLGGTSGWQPFAAKGAPPAGRVWSRAIYDPQNDRLVVFGGAVLTSPRTLEGTNETWFLDLSADSSWTMLQNPVPAPPPETAGIPVYDPVENRMLLVGHGTEQNGQDLWTLSLGATPTWSTLTATGQLPSWRYNDTVVYDSHRDRFLVFGGSGNPRDRIGVDVLTVRPNAVWSRLSSAELPMGRFGHATIQDWKRDRLVFFGGVASDDLFGGGDYTNETWAISLADPGQVQRLEPSGNLPPPRHEPVGVYDPAGDRGVFFGGWTYPENYFNDTWVLSFENGPLWTQAFPQGDPPPPRRADAAVYDPVRHRMLVYGGGDETSELGDLWALWLDEPMRWERLEPQGTPPHARYFASLTYDPLRDRVILYGGGYGTGSVSDIWSLELSDTLRWVPLVPRGHVPALERHIAVYDPAHDRILVHGGWDIDYDVIFLGPWVFAMSLDDHPAFTELLPPGPWPAVRAAHTGVFDAGRDQLVVWGGTNFGSNYNDTWDLKFDLQATRPAWLLSVHVSPGAVRSDWYLASGSSALLERRLGESPWTTIGQANSDAQGQVHFLDQSARSGEEYQYRVSVAAAGRESFSDAITVQVPGAAGILLLGARPNPALGSASELALWLPDAGPARLEIFDIRGRRIWDSDIGGLGKGIHHIALDTIRESGVYFARLSHGAEVQSTRFVTMR